MRTLILILITVFATSSFAGEAENILAKLRNKYPATHFDGVANTPLRGIYEIRLGENIAYTDATGDVWLFGHLYDMKAGRDITAERNKTGTLETKGEETGKNLPPSNWPVANAIVRVKGNGARKLYVISDTDCPYCRRIEDQFMMLDNVTIYTFPVAFVGDGEKVKVAWCAQDKASAWEELLHQSSGYSASAPCETPVKANTKLALAAGVRGTPTIFRADGDSIAGFTEAKRIDSWLNH